LARILAYTGREQQGKTRMPPIDTSYPNLRQNLNASLASRSDEAIEAAFERVGLDAEAAEGFFSDLGNFAKKLAPTVLPIAGTALGTVVGGPVGAALGRSLGTVAGQAIAGNAPPGGVGGAIGAVASGAVGGLIGGGGGSPAAGQLLQTLTKPETLQAVASMAMGAGLGKSDINVGGNSVPTGTFARLLSLLAGKMEADYNESLAAARESVPQYMQDFSGQAKGDPMVADHRAAVLYELLEASGREETAETAEGAEGESQMEAQQAEYDEMELMELYETEEA
jgi:hypothetical protein